MKKSEINLASKQFIKWTFIQHYFVNCYPLHQNRGFLQQWSHDPPVLPTLNTGTLWILEMERAGKISSTAKFEVCMYSIGIYNLVIIIIFLGRKYWYHSKDPVQISNSVQFQRCTWTSWQLSYSIGTLKRKYKTWKRGFLGLDLISIQIS